MQTTNLELHEMQAISGGWGNSSSSFNLGIGVAIEADFEKEYGGNNCKKSCHSGSSSGSLSLGVAAVLGLSSSSH